MAFQDIILEKDKEVAEIGRVDISNHCLIFSRNSSSRNPGHLVISLWEGKIVSPLSDILVRYIMTYS